MKYWITEIIINNACSFSENKLRYMHNKNFRAIFVKKISETIPNHIKLVDYLTDTLDISKVSAYRRINCQLPFTYDEIVEISLKLNISLDDMLYTDSIQYSCSTNKIIFTYPRKTESNIQDFFLNTLKGYYEDLLYENKSEKRIAILSINNVWPIYGIALDQLFKYFYYKCFLYMSINSSRICMDNITIPSEILIERDKVYEQLKLINNTIFIIDKRTYFNTIKDIQYYYRRKLINEKDLFHIKEDMKRIIKYTELQVTNGTYHGITHYFFLSDLNIYSNSIYVDCDNKCKSIYYGNTIKPLKTYDPNICLAHKKALEALKKNSVLISASNETVRMDFFQKQYEYLNNLIEDRDLKPL